MGALRNKLKEERGVVFILVIIALVVLLAFAALALDVGNVMVVRNELQNISDGSALAATRHLGSIYEPMSYEDQQKYDSTGDAAAIKLAAKQVGASNKADGITNVIIDDPDIEIGRWDAKNRVFTQNPMQPDAVRVTVRKDGSVNGRVATFFARIFGMNEVNVGANATAALTGQSIAWKGGLPIPVGISLRWFEEGLFCGTRILFYPTCPKEPCDLSMVGCGGWHTYITSPPNASQLRKMLDGLTAGTYESPETTAYKSVYEFVGGTIASAFPDMKELFDFMKTHDDDGNDKTWTTAVVVYDSDDCRNPTKPMKIVGFATVVIDKVLVTPEKRIEGMVLCDNVDPGRGSGGNYGTKGSIPGLVQ